jgi:predicted nucleic acid-binding protein
VIVVADASPLRYLILIEHTHVLPALYGSVLVPPTVLAELRRKRTPDPVKDWLSNRPDWLQVKTPARTFEGARRELGDGEREAIQLARELSADALLVDDRDAREEAERLGIPVLGTLRVLADASEHGFADLAVAFARLQQTNFRATKQLLDQLLEQASRRRQA